MVNLHGFSAFRIGESQKTFCLEISFFLSKSFVDPIPITGKIISVNNTSPVSSQHGLKHFVWQKIGFITLSKNKINENHGLLLIIGEGAWSKLCFVYCDV